MNFMNNRVELFKNLKNGTVLTYIAIVVIVPLFITNLVEYESLQNIFRKFVTQVVAVLGIIDDPNTNHFFEKIKLGGIKYGTKSYFTDQ